MVPQVDLAGASPLLLLFACVLAGAGLSYLSGLDLILEERFFYGAVIGSMAVSLAGFTVASLVGLSAVGVWLAGSRDR